MPVDRTILHCDCNSFFASVECLMRPELKEVPMAVCGDPESRHGIILAKNEPAKKYGIKTAETIWQAQRKCPQLVLVGTHFQQYKKFSRQINQIYRRYTDLVEPFSIDESWLDVTGSHELFGDGKRIADELRSVIQTETGLTVSVGVSFNKIFAKLGSDYKKPNATTVISRENYKQIVFPLSADTLMFCGKRMAQALAGMGIHTIGDLARSNREFLEKRLGKAGAQLHDYANGLDNSPVRDFRDIREVKSVGNSVTFRRDLTGLDDIRKGISAICDNVASRLRKNGVKCWVVQIGIKDPNLKTITRQKTLQAPTHLAKELSAAAMELIHACWNLNAPIRMLSVSGTGLVPNDAPEEQLCLFSATDHAGRVRQEHLENALDTIREKYGSKSVLTGGLLNEDIGLDGLHHKEEE
ncbi:MAG TPA: DNA polymerase IV [Caproicibacter sp.]|nr:DNA polymerase IV [Caproicibacter sp.]